MMIHTVYGKTFTVFMIFHSITNIYSRALFKYVIPFNSHTTWHYSSILKCKKIDLYLLSLHEHWARLLIMELLKQLMRRKWQYWKQVSKGQNTKHYYINTIPEQKASVLHIWAPAYYAGIILSIIGTWKHQAWC